jgi:hypothetical protein
MQSVAHVEPGYRITTAIKLSSMRRTGDVLRNHYRCLSGPVCGLRPSPSRELRAALGAIAAERFRRVTVYFSRTPASCTSSPEHLPVVNPACNVPDRFRI